MVLSEWEEKKASNAWHGRIREMQEKIWGMRLLVKAPNYGDCPVDQIEVDLGPHLHKQVKDTMKRRDKFVMRLQRVGETKLSPEGKFKRAMRGAVTYALENGLSGHDVMKETRDYCKRELQRLHDEEETDWEEEEEEEDGEYISVETSQKTREKAGTGLKVMNTGRNNNKKVPCPSADIKHAAPSKKPKEEESANQKLKKAAPSQKPKEKESANPKAKKAAPSEKPQEKESAKPKAKKGSNNEGGGGSGGLSEEFYNKFKITDGVSENNCGVCLVSCS